MTTCFKYILSVNANVKLIIQCSPQTHTHTHTLTNHTEIQNHLTRKYEKLATRIVQLAKYELNWTRKLKLATRTFQLATCNPQLELATRTRNSHSQLELATRNLQLATRRIPRPVCVLRGLTFGRVTTLLSFLRKVSIINHRSSQARGMMSLSAE